MTEKELLELRIEACKYGIAYYQLALDSAKEDLAKLNDEMDTLETKVAVDQNKE